MMIQKTGWFAAAVLLLSAGHSAHGQVSPTARTLLTRGLDETQRTTLRGNTRPEATAAHDKGRVAAAFRLEHMYLQLKRPAESEAALTQFISELHDPKSANFHHWFTA